MGDAYDFLYGAALGVEFAYAFDGVRGWHGVSFQLSCLFAAQVRMMQKMMVAVRKSRSPVFIGRVSLIVVGVVRVWGRVGMGSVG